MQFEQNQKVFYEDSQTNKIVWGRVVSVNASGSLNIEWDRLSPLMWKYSIGVSPQDVYVPGVLYLDQSGDARV
jgi:hypothetical protein